MGKRSRTQSGVRPAAAAGAAAVAAQKQQSSQQQPSPASASHKHANQHATHSRQGTAHHDGEVGLEERADVQLLPAKQLERGHGAARVQQGDEPEGVLPAAARGGRRPQRVEFAAVGCSQVKPVCRAKCILGWSVRASPGSHISTVPCAPAQQTVSSCQQC